MEDISLTFVHNSEQTRGAPAKEYQDFKNSRCIPDYVKDFSYYHCSYAQMMTLEKPDIVLVTSIHYLECRTALYFAKKFGVFTAYIPHGIVFPEGQNSQQNEKKLSLRKILNILKKLEKLPRLFYYTECFWRYHNQRLNFEKVSIRISISCFLSLAFHYRKWQFFPNSTVQEYYANLLDSAVFYNTEIEKYTCNNYGKILEGAKCIQAGTLDSARLALRVRNYVNVPTTLKELNYAYFISSPYPDDFTEKTAMILRSLLSKLAVIVGRAGCDVLIYRPHPGEPKWFSNCVCDEQLIKLDVVADLDMLIKSKIVCGTSSSLLESAVALKKPIITLKSQQVRWDPPYYEPLISYPRIEVDLDFDDFNQPKNLSEKIIKMTSSIGGVFSITERDPVKLMLNYWKVSSRFKKHRIQKMLRDSN